MVMRIGVELCVKYTEEGSAGRGELSGKRFLLKRAFDYPI